jgi:predicted MFS family arabinose efflux permease
VSSVPNTYLRVLRVPGGRSLLGLGSVARVGMGMAPLALILATLDAGGGFSRAGLAVGAYGVAGAVAGPVVGRLVDQLGARPVLGVTAVVYAGAVVGVVVALHAVPAAVVAVCVVAGATYPPLTAVLRGSWAALGRDDPELATLRAPALSLDAATFELVFVVGPVLVSVATAVASADAALYAVAAVTLLGTLALLPNPALPRRPISVARPQGSRLGVLDAPGFAAVVGVSGALGIAFGAVTVAVTAFADGYPDGPVLAGVLLAAWGGGSVLGGLFYAAHPPQGRLTGRLAVLLTVVAFSLAALAVVSGVLGVGIVLVIGGATIAPTLAVYTLLANVLTPSTARGEANTWLVSVPSAAQALGGWAAGLAVDRYGTGIAFAAAGVVVAASLLWVRWPSRGLARAEGGAAAGGD